MAGTAAIAVEFARLYAVELEHYEKVEGVPLTFPGKVNRLATMVRGNLGAALQGFVALPLLAGYDLDDPDPQAAGRIVSFDAAGGWNIEEEGYQSVGSGAIFAKSSMKSSTARSATPIRRCGWPSRRSTTPPMTTPRPAAPTWCAASIRRRSSSVPTAPRKCRGSHCGAGPRGHRKPFSQDTFGPDAAIIRASTRGVTSSELSIFHRPSRCERRAQPHARVSPAAVAWWC